MVEENMKDKQGGKRYKVKTEEKNEWNKIPRKKRRKVRKEEDELTLKMWDKIKRKSTIGSKNDTQLNFSDFNELLKQRKGKVYISNLRPTDQSQMGNIKSSYSG